jgi:hypothetical protein
MGSVTGSLDSLLLFFGNSVTLERTEHPDEKKGVRKDGEYVIGYSQDARGWREPHNAHGKK